MSNAARPGTHPEKARVVLVKRQDVVVRQTGGIRRVLPIVVESATFPIEQPEAVLRPDPQPLLAIDVESGHLVGRQTACIGGVVTEHELHTGRRVELQQPGVGPDPESAATILGQRVNPHRVPWIQANVLELAAREIEPIQPGLGAHPDRAAAILQQGEHGVVAKAGGVTGLVPEAYEPTLLGIEQGNTTLTCAYPQPARTIEANHAHGRQTPPQGCGEAGKDGMKLPFERIAPHYRLAISRNPKASSGAELHAGDEGVYQAPRVGAGLAQVLERITVEAVETILGAEPHESRRVLRDRQHRLLREAVVDPEALEAHRCGCGGFARKAGDHDEQRG